MKDQTRWYKSLFKNSLPFILIVFSASPLLYAQEKEKPVAIDPRPFADNSNHWYLGFDKHNMINPRPGRPKYKPTELVNIGDNILLFQKVNGGWPKNYDIMAILSKEQKDSVMQAKQVLNTTFDNGSTYTQVAALAVIYTATGIEKYKNAALKGLDFIIESQYKNGGWPQFYPIQENYSKYITYNDGNFTGIMTLLKDIHEGGRTYTFINEIYRRKLNAAYERGLQCIISTQITDKGKLTAWCQQHDPVSLKPAWARKFEPASICNQESADLVVFLMSIDRPGKDIINAVQHAAAWFEESRIYNTRVNTVQAPKMVTAFRVSETDRVVVTDSSARPIWTRYYELGTHRPIFCNRDSKIVYSLAEVDRERRDGYSWYTYSPQKVLDKYPQWKKKLASVNSTL